MSNPISPPHYQKHPSGIECIEITRWMNFNLGNVFKYIWRSDHKEALIRDLQKAQWYLADEIKRLQGMPGLLAPPAVELAPPPTRCCSACKKPDCDLDCIPF